MKHCPIICFSIIIFAVGCATHVAEEKKVQLFIKLPSSVTGITFNNKNTESPEANILTYEYFYNGGGVAIGDINNDGLADIFFTANQEENKLYLNKGDFKFEDISHSAGVGNQSGWRTGVAMADVNGDGYLDIYVCRSGWKHPLYRVNSLYINNKNLTFTDQAKAYGLDDDSFSTQACFLDFDKDGDLDLFLLNHSRLFISNSYDISKRSKTDRVRYVGNKFYRNDNGRFKDVSDSVGIFGPASNYGLGVVSGDVNNDGWTDLFTSNDYTEKDKMLLNQQAHKFKDAGDSLFTHLSQFSMGTDIADINNDGWDDIVSLDMLPADNKRQKEFHWPEKYDMYAAMFTNGLHYQYMRNMLQLNNGDGTFSEIGQLSGISNTDWSWAALFADYDNDGRQDLFVSDGFKRNFTSNDFLKYGADLALKLKQGQKPGELESILEKIPSNKVHAYLFRNKNGIEFEDVSSIAGFTEASLANGAAYADLDNDGDLDLVTNNIDEEAGVYRNNSSNGNYLKIKLQGSDQNTSGLGAKVTIYTQGVMMKRMLSAQRGFQSSVEPLLHFGLGNATQIDSLMVEWPAGETEVKLNVKVNQLLVLGQKLAGKTIKVLHQPTHLFEADRSEILFQHKENQFIDFKVQGLLPQMYSTEGPAMANADVNKDGLQDIFIGGAKGQAGAVFLQQANGSYREQKQSGFTQDAGAEDIDAVFFDMDKDGDQDVYVVSGGYEFDENDPLLQDRLYQNDGKGNFKKTDRLPEMRSNKSCVRVADIDGDGDEDLFVGGSMVPGRYPEVAGSYILFNDGNGKFSDATEQVASSLRNVGIVKDALWFDVNKDGLTDLLVAGEWMPLTLYINNKGVLKDETTAYIPEDTRGWWNCVAAADFDHDGDLDLIAGNFGMNNQYKPSGERPMTLTYADFDHNGSVDPIMSYYIGEKSYPSPTRDELTDQLPSFKKRFPDYASYTDATIETILTAEEQKESKQLTASTLQTVYLQNDGKHFSLKSLPVEAQFAPVCAVHVMDVNKDGHPDFVTGGNLSGGRARFGKATGNFGFVFLGNGKGEFRFISTRESGICVRGDVKEILQDNERLIFAINNQPPLIYKLK